MVLKLLESLKETHLIFMDNTACPEILITIIFFLIIANAIKLTEKNSLEISKINMATSDVAIKKFLFAWPTPLSDVAGLGLVRSSSSPP